MDDLVVHRLGTACALGVAAGCAVSWAAARMRGRAARRRVSLLLGAPPERRRIRERLRLGLRRRSRRSPEVGAKEAERQLPLAADLLAACLAAGAAPVEAAEVVGESLGGPVGDRLALAGAELRLGGEPGACWGRLAEVPGAAPLADCLERAARTGAPAADPVSRLASALREERARRAAAAAQRAAVWVTAPVGLCFLPAFLAIGVAPVVIGMASRLLSGN
ncbi:type II secretion system F family protein [Streptomyces sp. NPDC012888]|uniref:type II secretion system F family protein n=1 Tax=Streptomyces sp. NPDC012888 TaxID=3364855 RepID=UPI0036A58CFB